MGVMLVCPGSRTLWLLGGRRRRVARTRGGRGVEHRASPAFPAPPPDPVSHVADGRSRRDRPSEERNRAPGAAGRPTRPGTPKEIGALAPCVGGGPCHGAGHRNGETESAGLRSRRAPKEVGGSAQRPASGAARIHTRPPRAAFRTRGPRPAPNSALATGLRAPGTSAAAGCRIRAPPPFPGRSRRARSSRGSSFRSAPVSPSPRPGRAPRSACRRRGSRSARPRVRRPRPLPSPRRARRPPGRRRVSRR